MWFVLGTQHLLGKNYGAIFSVWDRMFGTLCQEPPPAERTEPQYYGVIPPLESWSPLWANVSHWHHILTVQCRFLMDPKTGQIVGSLPQSPGSMPPRATTPTRGRGRGRGTVQPAIR